MAETEDAVTTVANTEETPVPSEAETDKEQVKLRQIVEIKDVGPCKKHITVTINRQDIDNRINEKYSELVTEQKSFVAGFRPGKAPRKIVERFYRDEVMHQVRGEVLMASLEQIAEEHDIAPLSPPDLDPAKIKIPDEGALVYEFEVEVRPQFELPSYKGLKIKRPVKSFNEADVAREEKRLFEPYGQIVPKDGTPARVDIGDLITCDVQTRLGDQMLNDIKEVRIRVDPQLALKDGVAENFGKQVVGATAGESRAVDIVLSDSVANPALRGQAVHATFAIKDVKTIRPPEVTEVLLSQFGVATEDQLKELIRAVLERRLEYLQRQAARNQVIALVAEKALTDLPHDLLLRQSRQALRRKAIEMQSAGMTQDEVNGKLRLMQQDVIKSTTLALKEHFVLQKIAEDEKLVVNDDDIDAEINRMADRSAESPRKVRARLEREDMLEALQAELLESKALDLVLENAEYEDVPLSPAEQAAPVGTMEAQAVPGEMQDPAAEAEAQAEAAASER